MCRCSVALGSEPPGDPVRNCSCGQSYGAQTSDDMIFRRLLGYIRPVSVVNNALLLINCVFCPCFVQNFIIKRHQTGPIIRITQLYAEFLFDPRI